jgi:hypothetical protein
MASKKTAVTATYKKTKEHTEGDKRHCMPGWKLHWTCPKCGHKNVRDLTENYFSYPRINAPTEEYLGCAGETDDAYCEHEVKVRLLITQSLEVLP